MLKYDLKAYSLCQKGGVLSFVPFSILLNWLTVPDNKVSYRFISSFFQQQQKQQQQQQQENQQI